MEERGGEDLQSNNVPAVTENETIIEEEDPENQLEFERQDRTSEPQE